MPTDTITEPTTDLHIAALGLLSLDATQPPPPPIQPPPPAAQ